MLLLLILLITSAASADHSSFIFNYGFKSGDLQLKGAAHIEPKGLLALFNNSTGDVPVSHAFYPTPFVFKDSSSNSSSTFSFSTHFVFQMSYPKPHSKAWMTFVLAPSMELPRDYRYLGLVNESSDGSSSNHIVAVEIATTSFVSNNLNYDHVGININSATPVEAGHTGYYDINDVFHILKLESCQPLSVWVKYEHGKVEVWLTSLKNSMPSKSLISYPFDILNIVNQSMYVGFTASSDTNPLYVLGWSFSMTDEAQRIIPAHLPKVPKKPINFLKFSLPIIFIVPCLLILVVYVRRKIKYSEVIEDWEIEYISRRFKYKDLYIATQGFKSTQMVGKGGFGEVYKGVLRRSNIGVAVKRISLVSKQGIKEFVAEIVTIGQLRHRNLTPLLGYCHRKKEFLLVYEYMPNGSLEKHIHGQFNTKLDWNKRFHIIKGVAYGLLFLHEDWEQIVVHRDIKPSNVLLDKAWNARLGDFGLARLHDRGSDPLTTKIVGTLGYIAPEQTQTGKATTSSDIYGFGALMLEVATGRRPIGSTNRLVEWAHSLWTQNKIYDAIDPSLVGKFSKEEVAFVIKLGLVCSHIRPHIRPSIKDIIKYLENPSTLPQHLLANAEDFLYYRTCDDASSSMVPSSSSQLSGLVSISNSITVCGR